MHTKKYTNMEAILALALALLLGTSSTQNQENSDNFSNEKENFFIRAFKFKDPVIDTTGAGDAFNGAFAVALSKDLNIKEALTFANKVAGISTTKQGAAASMPSLEDLKNY